MKIIFFQLGLLLTTINAVAIQSGYKLWAQSFHSLMADIRQDINGVNSFSGCLNGTFP